MRTVLGILRRGLKILGWMGCGLSALLFVATVVLWVRSLGHKEWWGFARFEPRPEWRVPDLEGAGVQRCWTVEAIHGRLWLESSTMAPAPESESQTAHQRDPIKADEAEHGFDSLFQPGERAWSTGTRRGWRLGAVGFRQWHAAKNPWIGGLDDEGLALAVPFWMLTVLFGLWPGLVAGLRGLRWRQNRLRRKRLRQGLCLHCGYDLRATPDRCPECGMATKKG